MKSVGESLPRTLLTVLLLLAASAAVARDEPPLPEGLGDKTATKSEEPALPPGLAPAKEKPPSEEVPADRPELPFEVSGFWELRLGTRTQHDTRQKHISLAETRLQLELEKQFDRATLKLTTDFLLDPVQDEYAVDLEKGRGWLDLREAFLAVTPVDFMDVKVGRQVLTWGTGDLLFINDLFPKDWNAFFIGRDMEYLKAPSDAAKVSLFGPVANLDIVYTPAFDADRYIDGTRITYWNGTRQRRSGRSVPVREERPQGWFRDEEIALRLFKNVEGIELAAYAYRGYWKSPGGTNPVTGRAIFPDLSVYGASLRGALFKGIGNLEYGYYDSTEDRHGTRPLIRNSESRILAGYEQEVASDFTAGAQWYVEHMHDHRLYRRALPAGTKRADKDRHVLTLRLTKLLMSQNLKLSLFAYVSPTDVDAFLMPNVHYKVSDNWSVEVGGNLFAGEESHTFFGQFSPNTNVYAAARYSF